MFLGQLDERQKTAFLVLADKVIQSDGTVADPEETMLSFMKSEMGLPRASRPDGRSVEDAAAAFDTRAAKVAALLELIGLSMADGDFHDDEATVLKAITDAVGITHTEFEVMRNWVVRQLALVREASALMTAEA